MASQEFVVSRNLLKCIVVLVMASATLFAFFLIRSESEGVAAKGADGNSGTSDAEALRARPNIIFILIDALRADRMGFYGHNRDVSPAMDAIAAEGVVFDRAIAQAPWTQPSMASLFCSRYPSVHKVLDYNLAMAMGMGKTEKIAVFDQEFTTLAEVLQKAGYATAGFVANGFLRKKYGFEQGFGHYDDGKGPRARRPDAVLNNEMVAWLEKRDPKKPFFLYVHYMGVHGPYYARSEFVAPFMEEVRRLPNKRKLTPSEKSKLGYLAGGRAAELVRKYQMLTSYQEFWSSIYDAGIRETDAHIADLRKRLETMGLWDDMYVIITADHGEAFMEHGYWNHGSSLYHEELYVPLILRWPDVLPGGKRIKGTVRLIDLMPTLLDQLGLGQVADMQGRSLSGEIIGNQSGTGQAAFSEGVKKGPPQQCLYQGDWKLIFTAASARYELYHISEDPQEQNELSAKYPDKVEELTNLLQAQVLDNKRQTSQKEVEQIPVSPEQYERLRSLGYVD